MSGIGFFSDIYKLRSKINSDKTWGHANFYDDLNLVAPFNSDVKKL